MRSKPKNDRNENRNLFRSIVRNKKAKAMHATRLAKRLACPVSRSTAFGQNFGAMGCNSLVYVHLARLDCAELFKTSSVSFQGKSQYLQGSEVADLVGVTGAS